ncbi:MAG: hypothetical protein HC811_04410 [Flammeovirgaceae bacterium]|nr:hypothetical protein [Flammeovirgaceae bacterium]
MLVLRLAQGKETGIGSYSLFVENRTASSPYRNPFGSLEFSATITPKEVFDFIGWTEKQLIKKGVKEIVVKSFPVGYNPQHSSMLNTFLINHGFQIQNAELSSLIDVADKALLERMTSWEKRKLRQSDGAQLRFMQLPIEKAFDVYSFIRSCREERRQSISMTWDQVDMVVRTFSKQIFFFGVFDNQHMAAASLSIQVNAKILYNFYSGHARKYDSFSPAVMLVNGIYRFCQKEKFSYLDLGTSALKGKPNFTLLDFKMHLGALPTSKHTFYKKIKE